MVSGSYFSEVKGFDPNGLDDSQPYITQVATRALIFIESNNPLIGLMCFVGVGMSEVSSCEISVRKGDSVKKGDQIGLFHFGGSTHCLIFRPSVSLAFNLTDVDGKIVNMGAQARNIPINQALARCVKW